MITTPVQTNVARRLRSERGVTLIHVAASIFILMGFSAFVLDNGVLMLSRGQAQNVADMAALAGGIARAIDEPIIGFPANDGITAKVVQEAVDRHTIFAGTPANIGRGPTGDDRWRCPFNPKLNPEAWCVRVDVFRDGTNNSTPLPVYLASLFGTASQKMRATATAAAVPANGSRCMKPWLIPDRWEEKGAIGSSYDPMVDNYDPYDYGTPLPGTGYEHNDFFDAITLQPGDPTLPIMLGDLYEFDGASESSITSCQIVKTIGEQVDVVPAGGVTAAGVDVLLTSGPFDAVVGVYSPDEFSGLDHSAATSRLTIVNMMNVRITGHNGSQLTGVITGGVGDLIGAAPTPGGKGSMLKKVYLVR